MVISEKLNILEDMLDMEKGVLREDTALDSINEWDSIAVISTIAMFDSIFGREIASGEIKGFKTVKDIMDRME